MLETLKTLKDKGLATAVKAMLNEKYKAYGKVSDLKVDTSVRRVTATLDLAGERESVLVTLSEYEIIRQGDDTLVRLGPIDSSRPWIGLLLDEVANQTLEQRCYPIENRTAAELVKKLL